jgi:hypothetical protein
MKLAEERDLAGIRAELSRVARYDDESIVNGKWIRQRYECGCYATFAPARRATVRTAWHEAGHAVAALAVGARFSSASIHHSRDTEGRVHRIRGATDRAFVIDAGGQIAERLMSWTMLERDGELRDWLAAWRGDGGDARRFRRAIGPRFGADEVAAWRRSEQELIPLRLAIRQVARALLVHPRHLPHDVTAAIAGDCWPGDRGPAGLPAGGADAEDVEAVTLRLEALGVGELADGLGDGLLEAGGEGDVDHLAAGDAQQVMMVLGEVLGELEAGELVVGGHAPDDAGRLQVGQVPVGGATGQLGKALGDVADADRVTGADQQVDDGPPPGGVALVHPAQAVFDHAMQVAGGHRSSRCPGCPQRQSCPAAHAAAHGPSRSRAGKQATRGPGELR